MNLNRKEIQNLTARRHPIHRAMSEHWTFLEETYEGGREWFAKNIFRYHKEGESEYLDRVKRAYRFNHTREVVDLVNKYLFRGPIHRSEGAPAAIREFWASATKSGLSMDEFARVISSRSSIFGRAWVVVDSSFDQEVLSEAEAEETEGKVYSYLVSPLDVLDYSYDEDGELNWVLIREAFRDDEDPWLSSGEVGYRYRLWDRQDWHLVTLVGTKKFDVKTGHHGLGVVPVVPADNQVTDDSKDAPSLIADIAYLDRACANYVSNLDAIIQDQTFSQLTMPAQNLHPGDDAHTQLLEAGTKRVFTYDAQAGGKPEFISPDPKQAQLILQVINKIISEIYSSVGLAGENKKQDGAGGSDRSSGVAKSKDFERVNALLISKADAMELVENRIVKIACKWMGIPEPDHELVQYSDTFDVRELFDEFYIAMQLALISMPVGIRRKQMRMIMDKLFPFLGDEEREKLLDEIENWEPQSESAEAKDFISNATSKVSEEAKRNREASGDKQSRTKEITSESETNAITE